MRRRDFLLASILAVPDVRAQAAVPVIGFLNAAKAKDYEGYVAGFRRGLGEAGYAEGRNVAIEYRWADGRYDRLPEMASDLVRRRVAVIAANSPAALPAKAATSIIPHRVLHRLRPGRVRPRSQFESSRGQPDRRNRIVRGVDGQAAGPVARGRASGKVIAFLINPANPNAERYVRDARDDAFAEALVVAPDAFFIAGREALVPLAQRLAIPAIYPFREFSAHGLMTYAPSLVDAYRQMGVYTGRILDGERPGEMPVLQPSASW